MSELWKKDSFVNQNIPYLFNRDIVEYDMKDAGYSLIREFNQLDKKTIERLGKIKDKHERKVQIGLLEKRDPDFKKIHQESFALARQLFFVGNSLEDNDVISIKRDAIFTSKICHREKVGDYINFREKNSYTSYIRINKFLEFLYSPSQLDIKGMGDETRELHEDYMIKFIRSFFRLMETETETVVLDWLRHFIDKYKRRELEVGYYRTFDAKSVFKLASGEAEYDEYWEEDKDDLDIRHNYDAILIRFAKILL